MRLPLAAAVCFVFWPWTAALGAPVEAMIELVLRGQKIEGTPLAWNETAVHLLGRDGRLWQFRPEEATSFRQSSGRFRSYGPSEFRASLLRELGEQYEVSGTGHYLVAHPQGAGDKWAERFEDLYREFIQYFSVRGLKPAPPTVPLVAVVCRNRAEFVRCTAGQDLSVSAEVKGYYDQASNRIMVYQTRGTRRYNRWNQTESVIIHEATHQVAFNTGIHNRYAPPPLWVAEGLATMVEAPGVYDPRVYTQPSDRINRMRLKDFHESVVSQHRSEMLAALVASDGPFQQSAGRAYAEAWALSFFLMETEPHKYAKYLALTAAREPFTRYPALQRTADFTSVFGDDWRMLEARLLRFIAALK